MIISHIMIIHAKEPDDDILNVFGFDILYDHP